MARRRSRIDADPIVGTLGSDTLRGTTGADRIDGRAGDDVIDDGDFRPSALADDTLVGGTGNDLLISHGGRDVIDGGAGTDTASLRLGGDDSGLRLTGSFGTGGTAVLSNGVTLRDVENVILSAGAGNDVVETGAGADALFLGLGDDTAATGGGDDLLDLGAGRNTASGGPGADRFVLSDEGVLTVLDFRAAEGDRLQFFFEAVDVEIGAAFADGRLRATDSAAGAVIELDADGALAGGAYQAIAVLSGVAAAAITADVFV